MVRLMRSRNTPATLAAAKVGAGADATGHGPHHRSDERTPEGGAEGHAQNPAPSIEGGGDGQPGQTAGPRAGPGHALDEPGSIENDHRGVETEDEGGHAHDGQTDHDGAPYAEAGDENAAGQSADKRPHRIGGDQEAGTRLGQAQVVDVVREQRRERGEEDGVDQDGGAD